MSALTAAVGPAAADWLRTLYADRRTQARLEGCWNQAAHDEALSVVEWFATALQEPGAAILEWEPVVVERPPQVQVQIQRQMRML